MAVEFMVLLLVFALLGVFFVVLVDALIKAIKVKDWVSIEARVFYNKYLS